MGCIDLSHTQVHVGLFGAFLEKDNMPKQNVNFTGGGGGG